MSKGRNINWWFYNEFKVPESFPYKQLEYHVKNNLIGVPKCVICGTFAKFSSGGYNQTCGNPECFSALKSRITEQSSFSHKYKDTELTYQGPLEFTFLESFEEYYGSLEKLIEVMKRGPVVEYLKVNEYYLSTYQSDFIDTNEGIVYEVKSKWTFDKKGTDPIMLETNLRKLEALLKAGYKVVLVLDEEEIDITTESIKLFRLKGLK